MTPKYDPKNYPKNYPTKRSLLIHAHKAQDRAEMNIIRYMKRGKTEFLSSKLVQFFKQMSNANILAPIRDKPSNFSLRGRPESQTTSKLVPPGKSRRPHAETILLFRIQL